MPLTTFGHTPLSRGGCAGAGRGVSSADMGGTLRSFPARRVRGGRAFHRAPPSAASDPSMQTEQIFRPERHSRGDTNVRPQQPIDEASWIWRAGCDRWGGAVFAETRATPEALSREAQFFLRFRRDFDAPAGAEPLEIDVSADERYVLLLDGTELSRGPHRGLANRWHCHAVRVTDLAPGPHRLEAVCWQVGEHAPLAQRSVRGGFVLKASGTYDEALTTGKAPWLVAPLSGTRMTDKGASKTFGVGSECEVRGTSFLDEEPAADSWEEAAVVRGPVDTFAGLLVQGWMLFPTPLREPMRERKTPGAIRRGPDLLRPGAVVPAHARAVAFWDLGDYYCAYPELRVSGGRGARIRWDWAECLTGPDGHKGDRAACDGLDMPHPFGDAFLPDGRPGARFTTPWWRCGRWCRITVETAGEPLVVDSAALVETRQDLALEARVECDDPFVSRMQKPCERSLQMCMHEMFFDCPYYEQQMYPGDSRVQFLVSGLFDREDRMVRNALTLYDADRRDNGAIAMNCPTRGTQESFPFTCCEAMAFGDYAWNHADRDWLRARLPGLNHTLLGFDAHFRPDGLLGATPGWNFVDWVAGWKNGVPPDGDGDRPNAEINLECLHAYLSAAIAEEAVGDAALGAYWRARADALRGAIRRAFWCPERALFASDVSRTAFSQHAQALALLADVPPPEDAARCFSALVANSPDAPLADVSGPKGNAGSARSGAPSVPAPERGPALAAASIYFRHYVFATYFKFRRPDLFFSGLDFWRNCLDWHCSTILEVPDTDSRSDCHGWGSHPLWHLHAGVAGVRSAAPFYERVLVDPQPGPLRRIRCSTPTPRGDVELDLRFDGAGGVEGSVALPPSLSGSFRWAGSETPLVPGRNAVSRSAR